MSESLIFYYCNVCGAMSMHNFRDTNCAVCQTTMRVTAVEISGGGLEVVEYAAPHTE